MKIVYQCGRWASELPLRKFWSTLKIAATIVKVRTFGTYCVTHCDEYGQRAEYEWRGKVWMIPIQPGEKP